MRIRRNRSAWSAVVAIGLLLGVGCDLKLAGEDANLEPAAMDQFLTANIGNVPRIAEGINRLILTASGSPQPGVVIVPSGTGVQGSLQLDLDGDGTRERTVSGSISLTNPALGLAGGGTLTITGITGGSAQIGATTGVRQLGASTIQFGPGTAFFRTAGGIQVAIPEMSFTLQQGVSGPLLLGYMDFEGGDTSGTMTFESNGSGGWRIRATGNFTEFIVP